MIHQVGDREIELEHNELRQSAAAVGVQRRSGCEEDIGAAESPAGTSALQHTSSTASLFSQIATPSDAAARRRPPPSVADLNVSMLPRSQRDPPLNSVSAAAGFAYKAVARPGFPQPSSGTTSGAFLVVVVGS